MWCHPFEGWDRLRPQECSENPISRSPPSSRRVPARQAAARERPTREAKRKRVAGRSTCTCLCEVERDSSVVQQSTGGSHKLQFTGSPCARRLRRSGLLGFALRPARSGVWAAYGRLMGGWADPPAAALSPVARPRQGSSASQTPRAAGPLARRRPGPHRPHRRSSPGTVGAPGA